MKTIYALLVGIDNYPAPTPKLSGSKSDVTKIKTYLEKNFNDRPLHIKTLMDQEATYDSVIDSFRTHLSQATADDVIWFHYSGHGSRQLSAPEFTTVNSGGKDETLVLYDSRPSGIDLADKELAVLFNEISLANPHMLVTLDCCHSGSGTRGADEYTKRLSVDRGDKRTIDTYLKGYYQTRGTQIPEAKYIFYAACNRFQSAKESFTGGGLFTDNLIQTLNKSNKDISYADLLIKLRKGVVKMKWDQDPQMEIFGKTNSYTQFLDGSLVKDAPKYAVSFTDAGWSMEAGQILGITDEVNLDIYPDQSKEILTQAKVSKTSSIHSIISSATDLDQTAIYWAVPRNLPNTPFEVGLQVEEQYINTFTKIASQFLNVKFDLQDDDHDPFIIKQNNDYFEFIKKENNEILFKANVKHEQALTELIKNIDQIGTWTRFFSLQNNKTILSPSSSIFSLEIMNDAKEFVSHEPGEIKMKNDGSRTPYKFWIKNQFTQPLNYCLIYLNEKYGATPIKNDTLEKSATPVLFWGGTENDVFQLPQDIDSSTDTLLMIISTERINENNFALTDLEFGEIQTANRLIGGLIPNTKIKGEWYTTRFVIKLDR